MAKQIKVDLEEDQEKETNRFFKFIFIVFIPCLFAAVVAYIVLTFSGVNVLKEINTINPFAGSTSQNNTANNSTNSANDIQKLQQQLNDSQAKVASLQGQIVNQNNELQQAQFENNRLQQQMSSGNSSQAASKNALKNIITTYETMDPSVAAPIISKMSDSEALQILNNLKPQTVANIMGNMDPAIAARLTTLMTNNKAGQQNPQQSAQRNGQVPLVKLP